MKILLLLSLLFLTVSCFCQQRINKQTADTTVDNVTFIKYVIDSSRTIISAIDSTGKNLWVDSLTKFVYRDAGLEPPHFITGLSLDKNGKSIKFRSWHCEGTIIKESGKIYCCSCD